MFSFSERLAHASDAPSPSTCVGDVSQNMPIVGVKGPPMDSDNMFINFLLFSELTVAGSHNQCCLCVIVFCKLADDFTEFCVLYVITLCIVNKIFT